MGRDLQRLFQQASRFECVAVGCLADQVFFRDHSLELYAETLRFEHIAHADSAARHFVFVGRSNPARGGSNLRFAAGRFRGFVHFAMIRKDQVRAIAQEEASADFDAGLAEIFDLGHQRRRVNHGAGTDDGFFFRAQDPAGNQLQHEAMTIEDDGVTSVVSAGVARGVVERQSEAIDDFAFPFVAPLGSHNRNRLGSRFICQRRRSTTTRVAPCPLRLTHETLQEG